MFLPRLPFLIYRDVFIQLLGQPHVASSCEVVVTQNRTCSLYLLAPHSATGILGLFTSLIVYNLDVSTPILLFRQVAFCLLV